MQTAPTYRTNRNLFSNHYLEEHLPEKWDEVSDEALREAYDDIKRLWEREKHTVSQRTESQLKETFIQPMFRKLGIPFEGDERTSRTQRRPDYGFFRSEDAARDAFERRETGECDEHSIAVADAKRWGRPLDTRGSDEHRRGFENPSYQIHVYLQETPARWAVLTDGKRWRLYYGPTSHRLDSYYEIDLPTVLEDGDREDFKYFYLFFRHEAFLEDASGDNFLDSVYARSNVVSQELREDLQNNISEAIAVLSAGFVQFPDNDLDEDDCDLIYHSSLVYLYRLIVVLYAESESRGLLDTDNEIYEQSASLHSLKQEVAQEIDSDNPAYRDWQDTLWDRLDDLFTLIDHGSNSRGIPEEDLYIPAYNGDLFCVNPDADDSPEAQFLAEHKAGDASLATVIDLLTRSHTGGRKTVIDYSSLDVRHLGSIYEGVLEVTVAGADRKATGSFYTPAYIVEYIVENTLGPLVEPIRMDCAGQSACTEGGSADEFAERVFELNVLDPAMGSGHFLTSAVEYLAREIIDVQEKQAAQHGIESVNQHHDINWARRQVAQRCIYGVDLDPFAVELAKASVWLRTTVSGQPIAFLDHHLRTGNSIVGSDIEEIEALEAESGGTGKNPPATEFSIAQNGTIEQLLESYQNVIAIENRESADITEMKAKYDEFEQNTLRQRVEEMANVHTADKFGLENIPDDAYKQLAIGLDDDETWKKITETQWFRDAQNWAAESKYFHWKIAYPEVYYDREGSQREESGFDAVIGNPPWVATAGRGEISANIDTDRRSYLEAAFSATEAQFDLYVAFYEQSIRQSQDGTVGIIVPDAILTREQNAPIREYILSNTSLSEIVSVGTAFEGVETGAVILISSGDGDEIRCAESATGLHAVDYTSIPSAVFREEEAYRFLIYLDTSTRSILNKVENGRSLEKYIEISRGEEISKRAEFLYQEPHSDTRPIAPGCAVVRYGVDEDELRHIEPEHIEKSEQKYDSPKLLFRQTSDSVIGTYDERDLLTIKSAYTIHSDSGSTEELKHILGVLNSSVLNFYHHYKHAAYRSVFPQINQSTFEAFPIAIQGTPDEQLVEAVDEHLDLTHQRSTLNLRIADYLGDYAFGPTVGNVSNSQPADGVSETKLAATTEQWPNLRIGTVRVHTTSNSTVVSATARYKPDDESVATDRWGYTETDPVPAIEFVGLAYEQRVLVELFVPYAVENGNGFANFRKNATSSKSLYDRLTLMQLPRLSDVTDGLQSFTRKRERARKLEQRIQNVEQMIDERVSSLYGLTGQERKQVRDQFVDE